MSLYNQILVLTRRVKESNPSVAEYGKDLLHFADAVQEVDSTSEVTDEGMKRVIRIQISLLERFCDRTMIPSQVRRAQTEIAFCKALLEE
jgi:hypothetical protein